MFPFSASEIPKFDLDRYLRFGGLPAVVLSTEPAEELDDERDDRLYELSDNEDSDEEEEGWH